MPISDLRRQTSQIVQSVQQEGDVVYIMQHCRPAAVLVDYER
jgi:prevent-host-death family protein